MTKFVAIIFPDEAKAYEGTRALKALHNEGSLTLYSMAVIARDADGKLSVRQAADSGPLGTGVGTLVGGLAGLFGGPAGAAIGMGSGALIGGLSDVFNAGVTSDFVKAASERLMPGRTAVIAEVVEDWVTPLDTRMEPIGGIVIREWRSDFEDAQIEKEIAARKADVAQLREEMNTVREERKANLKARMDEAQARLRASADRAKQRINQQQQEVQAKVKEMQDQAAKAKGEAKAKLDQHIAEERADFDRRSGKLKQAFELTKEALV